jgi:hypothetical protein
LRRFLKDPKEWCETGVAAQSVGQMVTYSTRRSEGLIKRYGFEVIDRVQVTKYRALHPEPVLLSTVVKDLRPPVLTGRKERM